MKKLLSIVFALVLMLNVFTLTMLADTNSEITVGAPTDNVQTDNYSSVVYDEVTNPEAKPYGKWKAGSNTVTYLSDIEWLSCLATTQVSGDKLDQYPAKNALYKNTADSGITLAHTMKFDKGIGTHPRPVDDERISHVIIDISAYTDPAGDYQYDSLYSTVGLTNTNSEGVYFHIYGDKGDGAGYVKLACSELIVLSALGEFNVDISGVKTLALYVTVPQNYSSSGCAFADLCIFKADENAVKPDYSVEPDDTDDDDEGELVDPSAKDTTAATTAADTTEASAGTDETTIDEVSGACGSTIGTGIAIVGAVALCGATVAGKKRKDR